VFVEHLLPAHCRDAAPPTPLEPSTPRGGRGFFAPSGLQLSFILLLQEAVSDPFLDSIACLVARLPPFAGPGYFFALRPFENLAPNPIFFFPNGQVFFLFFPAVVCFATLFSPVPLVLAPAFSRTRRLSLPYLVRPPGRPNLVFIPRVPIGVVSPSFHWSQLPLDDQFLGSQAACFPPVFRSLTFRQRCSIDSLFFFPHLRIDVTARDPPFPEVQDRPGVDSILLLSGPCSF